jgi:malate dehydrogenase
LAKVTIIGGAGGVGASAAFNVLLGGGCDVVLVDARPNMVVSHVLDLEQTLELGAGRSVRAGDDGDIVDADVVVVTAGAPFVVNTSRLVYLERHAAIVHDLADRLLAAADAWQGVLVMVTNPVDPLCTLLWRRTGLDRRRIIGYTLNDTLRLRTGIGRALGVSAGTVDAWVLGEHGDASVPLFDRVRVAGEPVELTPEQQTAAEEFLRTWYVRHVALDSGRSSTWTSGLGVARLVDAILRPAPALWPASVVLAGEYGIDGASVGVPVSLGPGGVEEIHEWELAPENLAALQRSAVLVREATDRIDVPG